MQQKLIVNFENLSEVDKRNLIEEVKAIEGVSIVEIKEETIENSSLQAKGDTTVIIEIVVSVVSALTSGLVLEYFKFWLKSRPSSKISINGEDTNNLSTKKE